MGRIKKIAKNTEKELEDYLEYLGWSSNPFTHPATLDEYVLPNESDIADIASHINNYTGPILIHSQYSGVGKTTLLKNLMEEYSDRYQTIYVGEHNVTPYELAGIIADEIGVGKSSSTKLTEQKIRDADLDTEVLVGVDEFGLNDPDTLHVIQYINDLEGFKVMLTGMTSQWTAIGELGSDGRAFQRRVAYRLKLEPFDFEQTKELYRRRVAEVDGSGIENYEDVSLDPFGEDTLLRVHEQSMGVAAVVTAALSKLLDLGAYRYANDQGVGIPVELASEIDYATPKVEESK